MLRATVSRLARGILRYGPNVILDAVLAIACFSAGMLLRSGGRLSSPQADYYLNWFVLVSPLIAATYVASAWGFNLYRRAWRYASLPDLAALTMSVALATVVLIAADLLISPLNHPVPLGAVVIGGGLTYLALAASKFYSRIRRFLASGMLAQGENGVLIAGAGQTGQFLAHQMLRNRDWNYQPVCFVDDDPRKKGLRIHGVPVHGCSADIPRLVEAYHAGVVALAMPSATADQMRAIIDICQPLPVRLLVVPDVREIFRGDGKPTALRELRIEDLLGRASVEVDLDACRDYVGGRVVLVTGAAGSIGSELSRQILALRPSTLVLFDNNESGVYDLELGLRDTAGPTTIVQCIGSVADDRKVNSIFRQYQPRVVFHAAAYKHVPLMEQYPEEAIRTNVIGTRTVSHAAERHGCERFVLVSTDKAVNPCNVMGATKRLAELTIKELAPASGTVFCAVRFGNVLGSRGSVVPVFTHQIDQGGPITITHPDVTRFFMTIPEAVRLIIQAGSFALGGDVFILDMGEPVRIVDLAAKMVRFRGLRLGENIQIKYTGLRPGERLYEELSTSAESVNSTSHPKILRLKDSLVTQAASPVISELEELLTEGETSEIRGVLMRAVTEDVQQQIIPALHRGGYNGEGAGCSPNGHPVTGASADAEAADGVSHDGTSGTGLVDNSR